MYTCVYLYGENAVYAITERPRGYIDDVPAWMANLESDMPLPTQPTAKPPVAPNLKKHNEDYQSPVVDTRRESYDTLVAFPAGQRMDVDYYGQQQGRDSAAASFQEDLLPALGQLWRVRGFEFVVTSPFSHSQSPDDSRGWESTGSSLVYSVITPQVGDVFIADIGMGISALQ